MKVSIIFSNRPSVINKKLLKFCELNLLNFNKANIVFDFEVATPDNAHEYKKRGMTNFPVLLRGEDSVAGSEKIMQYLRQVVKKYNNRILNKSETDKLNDFWNQTIGKIEVDDSGNVTMPDDDDDEPNAADDLHHKIQQAFEARSAVSEVGSSKKKLARVPQQTVMSRPQRGNNLNESPVETIKNMQSGGKSHMDDVLMAKFFENQESSI